MSDGRVEPADLGVAVHFLASDETRVVTRVQLPVDAAARILGGVG